MNIFFDNNLPRKLCAALGVLFGPDNRFEHLQSKFPDHAVSDLDWIEAHRKEGLGWVVLTGDRLNKNSAELEAVRSEGLTFIILDRHWNKLSANLRACRLVCAMPSVLETARSKPGVHLMSVQGRLKPWGGRR